MCQVVLVDGTSTTEVVVASMIATATATVLDLVVMIICQAIIKVNSKATIVKEVTLYGGLCACYGEGNEACY